MFDRRVNNWIAVEAHLFTAVFDDGLTIEIQVNPEFRSISDARAEADKYGKAIGQIPTVLRTSVATLSIHKGDQLFGGVRTDNAITIHTDFGERVMAMGFLEEVLVHEAAHSLDFIHAKVADWIAAQTADGNYISTYARDYPEREDIAESYMAYLAVRFRSDRISPSDEQAIMTTIPNRIAYFDAQSFDNQMPPITGDRRGILDFAHFANGEASPPSWWW